MASVLFSYLSRTYQWNFSNKIQVPYIKAWCKFQVFVIKKQALLKMSFYQQSSESTISIYSWFFVSLVLQYIF